MRYLFDSSSIYKIASEADTSKKLLYGYTCSLVRYELGNILITETRVRKTMTEIEQKRLLPLMMSSLNLVRFIALNGEEGRILEIAIKYGLSFYDASYVYAAKKASAVLVTEDGKLAKKVGDYIKTVRAEEVH